MDMQSPFDKYAQVSQSSSTAKKSKKPSVAPKMRSSVPVQQRSSKSIKKTNSSGQATWIISAFFGLLFSLYVLNYTDHFLSLISRLQVSLTTSAQAQDGAKSDGQKVDNGEKSSSKVAETKSSALVEGESLTMETSSVYKALRDKEKSLQRKERELARLEEDLHKQKQEIEKQLGDLSEMRRNISSKLETKITADQESIGKLVGVYSDMKPQNAALIMTQIDESLAVEVLGQMKKQNAAAILNFMQPDKAQKLSEKYAGLKR
jgi:flagellar motility protein MotE (MotC chaperone)